MSERPIALVGFAEALAGPEAAWSLVDAGFDVVAWARRGRRAPLRQSRLVTVLDVTAPEEDVAAATAEIAAHAKRIGAHVVMPLDDASVHLVESARTQHGLASAIAGPVGPQARLALDKRIQFRSAARAGLRVPATWFVGHDSSTAEPLRADDAEPTYPATPTTECGPLIVKPAMAVRVVDGRIGRGDATTVTDDEELARVLARCDEPMIAQAVVTGDGEGAFGLATDDGVHAWSGHRRIRMMNPSGSGSSACRAGAPDDDVRAGGAAFLADADWRGLFMLEFVRDAQGTPWFMELNGRTWGSTALARRCGFEYPAWSARLALDPTWRPAANPPGHAGGQLIEPVLCRHLGREIVHALNVLRGPQRPSPQIWPGRLATTWRLIRGERGQRWYNARSDDRSVFWSDAIGTVRAQFERRRTRKESR